MHLEILISTKVIIIHENVNTINNIWNYTSVNKKINKKNENAWMKNRKLTDTIFYGHKSNGNVTISKMYFVFVFVN